MKDNVHTAGLGASLVVLSSMFTAAGAQAADRIDRLPDRMCQGVAATGQTQCFYTNGDLGTCGPSGTGTGQDGEYQNGWTLGRYPRFTDRGDGTVKDNLTGLTWLKNADCFGLRGWTRALEDANTLASPSCGLADGSVAGDWRLPNIREIQSLIDYGQFDPALPPVQPFSAVQSATAYWSSTSFQGVPNLVWIVGFQGGQIGLDDKAFAGHDYHVWPVRDGS